MARSEGLSIKSPVREALTLPLVGVHALTDVATDFRLYEPR